MLASGKSNQFWPTFTEPSDDQSLTAPPLV